jgi:hypothetical protein
VSRGVSWRLTTYGRHDEHLDATDLIVQQAATISSKSSPKLSS